jgi:Adenylate and Guanylate cyclase catalytic domain
MKRTQTIISNQVLLMLCAVADIAGFTAWSSIREPHQVFTLLEAIFKGFDSIAKRQGIFKVETIGDCYVGMLLLLVCLAFDRNAARVTHSLCISSISSSLCFSCLWSAKKKQRARIGDGPLRS